MCKATLICCDVISYHRVLVCTTSDVVTNKIMEGVSYHHHLVIEGHQRGNELEVLVL